MAKILQGYRINSFPQGFAPFIESQFEAIHDYEGKTRYGNTRANAIYWYGDYAWREV